MKVYKFNKRDIRVAPWTALCVLSLIAAMVFAVPSVVFAQITGVLSQDCDTALVGTDHTITATVTDGVVPVEGVILIFQVTGANSGVPGVFGVKTGTDGTYQFTYTGNKLGFDNTSLIMPTVSPFPVTIMTEWTADDQCSESPGVTVGGRLTLNAKKKGALKIAVCATDGLKVSNVDPKTVELAGVAPFHWKQKDSRLCPDGKDGVKDLVLKFKNREVVEALEYTNGELADGDKVDLALTGSLDDGTTFDGVWKADIKKKGKRHWKKKHHQKKDKKDKKDKGSKK